MKYLRQAARVVTVFCLMTILFTTSVEAVIYWMPGYLEKEYAKYSVLDSLSPVTMDSLLYVADEMTDYLRGDRNDPHVTTTMGGEQREFFNEREVARTEGVQVLFLKAPSIHRACPVLGAGLFIPMAATRARMGRIPPPSPRMGVGLFLRLITVLGPIISTDFTKYFILFHHIFFANDLWTLDPATDMLINIVLEGSFVDTAARTALLLDSLSLILSGICLLLTVKNCRKEGRVDTASEITLPSSLYLKP